MSFKRISLEFLGWPKAASQLINYSATHLSRSSSSLSLQYFFWIHLSFGKHRGIGSNCEERDPGEATLIHNLWLDRNSGIASLLTFIATDTFCFTNHLYCTILSQPTNDISVFKQIIANLSMLANGIFRCVSRQKNKNKSKQNKKKPNKNKTLSHEDFRSRSDSGATNILFLETLESLPMATRWFVILKQNLNITTVKSDL